MGRIASFFRLFMTSSSSGLEGLTTAETALLESLRVQRADLAKEIVALAPHWDTGANPLEFLAQHREAVVRLSDRHFDYKVLRIKLFTDVVYRLVCDAARAMGHQSQTLEKLHAKYELFLENYAKVPVLLSLSGKEHEDARDDAAAYFDSINPPHRDIVDLARTLQLEVRRKPPAFWTLILRPLSVVIEMLSTRFDQLVTDTIVQRLTEQTDLFGLTSLYLKSKFFLRGKKLVDENLILGLREPLEPHQVNFIVAPHGSREEVALTSARIAGSLPRGRKLAVLLAAYHFVPEDEYGLVIANAMNIHPGFIVVLTETSPFMKETSRYRNEVSSEPFHVQVRKAMEAGFQDIVVFSEGRLPPRGGGLTPANLSTFRLPTAIRRQRVEVNGESRRLEPVFTILSGNFSNAELGYGVGKDPLLLSYEFRADPETTKALAEDRIGFTSLVDAIWHIRAYQLNQDRVGSAASDEILISQALRHYSAMVKVDKERHFLDSQRCPSLS